MASKLGKILGIAGLTATILATAVPKTYAPPHDSGYNLEIQEQFLWDKAVKEQDADKVIKPYFRLKPSHCAQYARLAARKLFNKKYVGADAWNLKYNNPVVYDFDKEDNVKEAIIENKLSQGMLITAKWPIKNIKQYGNFGLDEDRNPIESTHVVEYIGIGTKTDEGTLKIPEPIFLHQWGRKMERKTQRQLWEDYKLTFNKIINDKDLSQSE